MSHEARYRFSLPNCNTPGNLPYLVTAYGGPELVCRDLRVSRELLDLWLSGEVHPPFYFQIALWWQGPYGFSQGFAETHFANSRNYQLLMRAVDHIAVLERLLSDAGRRLGQQGESFTDDILLGPVGHELRKCITDARRYLEYVPAVAVK